MTCVVEKHNQFTIQDINDTNKQLRSKIVNSLINLAMETLNFIKVKK